MGFVNLHHQLLERASQEWRDRALCTRRNPDLYDLTHVNKYKAAEHAAEVCYGCPVMAECAKDAQDSGDRGVIRAGCALPMSLKPVSRARLNFVAEHGRLPTKLELRENVAPDTPPDDLCVSCNARMRPTLADEGMWPGTVPRSIENEIACESCYLLWRSGWRRTTLPKTA